MARASMPRNLHNERSVQSLLDSDNEYPDLSSDELDEDAELPAYLRHDRFNNIYTVAHSNVQEMERNIETSSVAGTKEIVADYSLSILHQFQTSLYMKMIKGKNNDVVIDQWVLSQQDLLCLRELEPNISDAVMMWFLNYLKRKDLRKVCEKNLISCLTIDSSISVYEAKDIPHFKKLHHFTLSVL